MKLIQSLTIAVLLLFGSVAFSTEQESEIAQVLLSRTGQILCYDESGEVVDFQGSGLDGEFQRGSVWPEPRFIVNKDGTVTDNLTGLMWLKDGNCFGKLPWSVALVRIAEFNISAVSDCRGYTGKYNDWALPNLNELASLINAEEVAPADYLRIEGITDAQPGQYWSATSYQNLLNAWAVSFDDGSISFENKLTRHFALLVRVDDSENRTVPETGQKESSLPGDDGETRHGVHESDTRYSDNGDGTITDTMTGLMWVKDASCFNGLSWQGALDAINGLNGDSGKSIQCAQYQKKYTDWSMPNIIELRSIINYSADYPALSKRHSFQNLASSYWSSTTIASSPANSYAVNVDTGSVSSEKKVDQLSALPVRLAFSFVENQRIESSKWGDHAMGQRYVMRRSSELQNEISWPPAPRFFANGDGTSMDVITGINWLTDANCFEKLSWKDSFTAVQKFNNDPRRYTCQEYSASFEDWQVPARNELVELLNPLTNDSAAWLNSQGVVNVQSTGDYWSADETPLNLYFAYVFNMKKGGARNYPKSLQFYLWPHRKIPDDPKREPLLNVTINGLSDHVKLSAEDTFSAAVYLHSFALRYPADFWFWYETPQGVRFWLNQIRAWQEEMVAVYQGNLFNLKNYEIFKSDKNKLEPGEYTFHFAVDANQNGVLDDSYHEAKAVVEIKYFLTN